MTRTPSSAAASPIASNRKARFDYFIEETVEAGTGTLFRFDAHERHRVASREGARILLLLAPWPGAGHYRGSASA